MYNVKIVKKYLVSVDMTYRFIHGISKFDATNMNTEDLHCVISASLDIIYSQSLDVSLKMMPIVFYNDWTDTSSLNFTLTKNIIDGANIGISDYEVPTPRRLSSKIMSLIKYEARYKATYNINKRILNSYITSIYTSE